MNYGIDTFHGGTAAAGTILENRYKALQHEIAHTDHREFKQMLRGNEKLIEAILSRLRTAAVAKAS